MDLFALTRRLVDIESITPNEGAVGNFLCDDLRRRGFESAAMPVEGARANVLATWPGHPRPEIVFSTHMDTVPPFIPSSEDDTSIYGRGSCDAKGIIAAQVVAAEKLRSDGIYVGMLFLVGEERDSIGAKAANQRPIGSRFMINGERHERRFARRTDSPREDGAFGISGTGRIGDRQTGGSVASSARNEVARESGRRTMYKKCRLHSGRTRAERDLGHRQS